MMFSRQQIMANGEFELIELPAVDRSFDVPAFFFSGTQDQTTPIELAEEYLGLLAAPHKELVRFQGDGHFFLFNRPDRFFAEFAAAGQATGARLGSLQRYSRKTAQRRVSRPQSSSHRERNHPDRHRWR